MPDDPRVARVRDVFNAWAAEGRAEGMAESHTPFVLPVFQQLPLPPDGWYLDIGCGNGYTVRWAAQRAPKGRAFGLDVAPQMIQRATELSRAVPNTEFRLATFPGEHGLEPGRFDVIFSMEVFYYLPDLHAGLTEVRRLLRPGGTFACQVDFYRENEASHAWPDDLGVPMTLLGEVGWQDAFTVAGLTVADQFRVRVPPEDASASWKAAEGSLVTVGTRPA